MFIIFLITRGLKGFRKLYYIVANKPLCEIAAFEYEYNIYI
jgi:hypothetical protein